MKDENFEEIEEGITLAIEVEKSQSNYPGHHL